MKKACCNCLFYCGEKAECRRNPPQYGTPAHNRKWPEIFADDISWCGEFKEKEGGPEDYVKVEIVDNKTGQVAYSGPYVCYAPKPGQVMIWEIRTEFHLSNDFSIRVDWPTKKDD